jgi:hypothetical protein
LARARLPLLLLVLLLRLWPPRVYLRVHNNVSR